MFPPQYEGDAGFDMIVSEYTDVYAHAEFPTMIPCGIRVALPKDTAAIVMGRSSVIQRGLFVLPTLIDASYRGPMYILAYNMTEADMCFMPDTRIAQLVLFPAIGATTVLKVADVLPETTRGSKGFGSTGE